MPFIKCLTIWSMLWYFGSQPSFNFAFLDEDIKVSVSGLRYYNFIGTLKPVIFSTEFIICKTDIPLPLPRLKSLQTSFL